MKRLDKFLKGPEKIIRFLNWCLKIEIFRLLNAAKYLGDVFVNRNQVGSFMCVSCKSMTDDVRHNRIN